MTSKIGKPSGGQQDQKKLYLNWANHYLRKSGSTDQLADLKDISDGKALPSLLKAVVQEEVPQVHAVVQNDEERRENIDQCVQFLQRVGLNCSTFNSRDLCDGKDRAILSLFYSLSQYKRKPSQASTPASGSGLAAPSSKIVAPGSSKLSTPGDSHTLPASRIVRPVSPGLKVSLGVNGPSSSVVSPVSPSTGVSPGPIPSGGNTADASLSSGSCLPGGGSGLPGSGSGVPTSKSLTMPGGKRRTAGSSISTSTTFMKPRKIPQKTAASGDGESGNKAENSEIKEEEKQADGEQEPDNQNVKEVKSDSESEDPARKPKSKVSKFGSFSAGQASGLKDLREGRKSSMPTKSTSIAEGAESVTPPSQSKLRGPAGGFSKLQGLVPPHKNKEATPPSSVSNEDPHEESARKEPPERPQSRLKALSSGRGTPVMGEHPRPASQMGRRVSGSTSNLTSSGEELPPRSESRLRMMRKGSDGALKKHQVLQTPRAIPSTNTIAPPASSETKTSSLPRHMPKDSVPSYQASAEKDGAINKKKEETGRDTERSLAAGLRKPGGGAGGGLRKPGTSSGIRTPNMPSGPLPASAEGGRQAAEGRSGEEGGAQEKAPPTKVPAPKDSPKPTRSLGPPSRISRPTSPSPRNKTYKINHETQPTSASSATERPIGLRGPGGLQRHAHLKGHCKDETGSSSSLDSGSDVQVGVSNQEVGVVNNSGTEKSKRVVEEIKDKDVAKLENMSRKEGATGQVINIEKVPSEERLAGNGGKLDVEVEPLVGVASQEEVEIKTPEVKDDGLKGGQEHVHYGRRISPEGMSHEDINLDNIHSSNRGEEAKEGVVATSTSKKHLSPSRHSPSHKGHAHIITVDTDDSESASSTDKEGGANRDEEREGEQLQSRSSSQEALGFSPSHGVNVQRARSLSPKASHRLVPRGVARLKDTEGNMSGVGVLQRSSSSDSTSSEGTASSHTHSEGRKPLKSSLRSGGKVRRSSSSSAESGSPRQTKVTISPRSSQLVYDPEEACLHPVSSHHHIPPSSHLLSPNLPHHQGFIKGSALLGDRPMSFASVDSSTTSDSLSPSSSNNALYPRSPVSPVGGGVTRHASMRSAMGEHEYHGSMRGAPPSGDGVGSTPELIESFENQLTNMKEALTSKERMLHIYENSMADLSTKMNMLKKSLEEKDNKIRTLEKSSWFDLEGQSLMADSRAPSVIDHHEGQEPLSDGYLSDSAMDQAKEKKKKKPWNKLFKSNKKKEGSAGGVSAMEHMSANMDTESIISTRSSKAALKRTHSKKKAPDLVSISEYSPEGHMRDVETKSTYTVMDMRGDFGMPATVWEEESTVKVYEDDGPGTRAEVILVASTSETPSQTTPNDDLYGDILSRHVIGGGKWGRDSAASSLSSDSGNHDSINGEEFILGTLSVPPDISWVKMDGKVEKIIMHYISSIDSEKQLGLSEDSVYCYHMGDERRQIGNALLPPATPYEALANKCTIKVYLKDAGQQSCDALSFRLLMGKESLLSYMGILQETHWLVVMGTKGTCKSSLVTGLAQHLSACLKAESDGDGMEDLMMGVTGGEIVQFNLDKEGLMGPLKYFKNDLAKRVQLQLQPPIVVLEDIYDCKDLEQLLAAAGGLSKKPYIIAALSSGTTRGVPLHQLLFHYQIRVVSCNPQADPIQGILTRSLKKQIYQQKAAAQSLDSLIEHLVNWIPYLLNHLNSYINKFHSNSVNLGPRVFMSCPLNQSAGELENWFISLWNHFIIPYLMGTIMAGIETYTADPMLDWVDVREWVLDTYPWQDSMSLNKLRTLNPEDVGWNHAVRPHHQSRFIMVKDDKLQDDTRSLLHHDTRSLLHHDTRSLLNH